MKPAADDMRRRSGLFGFLGLSGLNQIALAESLVTLAFVSLAIKLAPFRSVVKLLSKPGDAKPAATPEERTEVIRCRWAVERLAALVPWRTVCFQKGLALHLMLRRRRIASFLHYGVLQNAERGLAAHVWVSESDRIVIGGEIAADYSELARFPAAGVAEPVAGQGW
ncbi:MAG: stage sporulation protein [Alphaproteobacteria bacterium]|nr:stage sporulation protein [Alphaproteobacteria bacterium]